MERPRDSCIEVLDRVAYVLPMVFHAFGISVERAQVITFLRQAMEAERASFEVVVRVADFLRKAEHDPGLRFEVSQNHGPVLE